MVLRLRSLLRSTRLCRALLGVTILCGAIESFTGVTAVNAADAPRKIVLIAGPKSHGPVGNGIHDYPWSVQLLKVMLDNSNIAQQVQVEYHLEGWPEDPATLDTADTIMVISDGRDGDKYVEAPHFQSPEHRELIARQMRRGCGFATFHFSTFAPDASADDILNWSGAYFDWETDGQRQWYSAIQTADAELVLNSPQHPISRGITPFQMKEEFYFNLRFREQDAALKPILSVPALPGRDPDGRIVAWAREREDGGRGFGTTCGHFYENWKNPEFRRLILNALAWTAHVEVPDSGVLAEYYTHEQITRALTGLNGTQPAVVDDRPIRALILGGQHHPGHPWQATSPLLKELLQRDSRLQVDLSEQIEDLAGASLNNYDLLVLNYCNWKSPGLSPAAKQGLMNYLQHGGGLIIVHFANGAFHFSLPEAGDSDWPEYRNICRRVWDHTPGLSGHDAFGKFIVEIDDHEHPITRGLEAFPTTDELYFRQQGTAPIHVLASAKSQVTGQMEPMAFVYDYGQGRVFQTVLGHAADSLRAEGTAEMLRRAAAWVANRTQIPASVTAKATPPAESLPLAEGRFGQGLNARLAGAWVEAREEYQTLPLTVECWARIDSSTSYNILLAQEQKSSATHWELFTPPQSGVLTAYLPGRNPDHTHTASRLTDDQWHHIAMTLDAAQIRLYVDGRLVAEQSLTTGNGKSQPGNLAMGRLLSTELGCAGVLDEVRLSRGVREIIRPDAPFAPDDQTIGLWHFDELQADGTIADASAMRNPARPFSTPAISQGSGMKQKIDGHWGEDAVGFRWTEQDSVDGRWNQSNVGPFLASTIPLPNLPPIAKGLSLRLGAQQDVTVCFDTRQMQPRAAWTGEFLKFSPNRFGLIESPRPAGTLLWASPPLPELNNPSPSEQLQYTGLSRRGQRVLLHYRCGSASITEAPWAERIGSQTIITRTLNCHPGAQELILPVFAGTAAGKRTQADGVTTITFPGQEKLTALALVESAGCTLELQDSRTAVLKIAPTATEQHCRLSYWSGPLRQLAAFREGVARLPLETPLNARADSDRSAKVTTVTTRGVVGDGPGPYVIDTLTLPFENPDKALMFVSGHDFFANGDVGLCTVHGDIWRVSGVDAGLQQLTWKRIATGLFQPLGLKIVEDQIYVLGRDQISRLEDGNGDGVIDSYHCFYNGYLTSPGGHDYLACLETDSQGNFYFVHAVLGVVRVMRDGSSHEVIATGLRNPNGMSVGPDDTITAAPQEGDWTPASAIFEVRRGNHFGYGGPKVSPERPLGYDPPLCWIPRLVDNSTGGQAWVTSERWGPLTGQLLNFSFGKCRMMLVLREHVDGTPQGGIVEFPLNFDSGVMRGRFHPRDGQLYVSGLRGWVSSAVLDGCLQRVRYTGAPVQMPVQVQTYRNGLAITCSTPLQPAAATNLENYQVQQWNYRYAADYGSLEYRPSKELIEGRDDVELRSATLLADGKTLFLEIADFQPVMQLSVRANLITADGSPFSTEISYTVNRLGQQPLSPELLTPQPSSDENSPAFAASRTPGVLWNFQQQDRQHVQGARLPALFVAVGTPPASGLQPGPFSATATAVLRVPKTGRYQLRLEGTGGGQLSIDGMPVVNCDDLAIGRASAEQSLTRGPHALEVCYTSPPTAHAALRVLWQGEDFPEEPLPPQLFFHSGQEAELLAARQRQQGADLYATQHCNRCHHLAGTPETLLVDLLDGVPDLRDTSRRLQANWIYRWVLHPHASRPQATMPDLLNEEDPAHRQLAADIAAWLTVDSSPETAPANAPDAAAVAAGETVYATQGCYSCHRFSAPAEPDEWQRLSLAPVGDKYRPGALAEFLRDPQQHAPLTRMPNFRLTQTDADALAAYLVSRSAPSPIEDIPELALADPQRGHAALTAWKCTQCHATSETVAVQPSIPLPVGEQHTALGCLGSVANSPAVRPAYSVSLSSEQQAALTAFLKQSAHAAGPPSAAQQSQRLWQHFQCSACHARDDQSSRRAAIYLEEFDTGFLPEPVPSLTWGGEKLHSDWVAQFLSGNVAQKPRAQLQARMPAFPAAAAAMASGLAAEHGLPLSHAVPTFDPALANIGQQLSLNQSGLDCRQCHGVGSAPPAGDAHTQIAVGINFSLVRDRLRPEYYRRFVLDPPRYDVATKMPKLAVDGKMTKILTYFDGNAARQFDALWNYIQSLPPAPAP